MVKTLHGLRDLHLKKLFQRNFIFLTAGKDVWIIEVKPHYGTWNTQFDLERFIHKGGQVLKKETYHNYILKIQSHSIYRTY